MIKIEFQIQIQFQMGRLNEVDGVFRNERQGPECTMPLQRELGMPVKKMPPCATRRHHFHCFHPIHGFEPGCLLQLQAGRSSRRRWELGLPAEQLPCATLSFRMSSSWLDHTS